MFSRGTASASSVRQLTFVFVVAIYSMVFAGGHAAAQAKSNEPAEYRALVNDAVREYEARHFEEARSLFAKAAAILPSARALRGVGMSEFELRNYADSAENLEQALASNVQKLDGELRAETERLLQRARSFVARLSVAVEPKAATVIVDGQPFQLGPDGDLVLEVGDHVLEFRAEGYVPEKQRRKVRGGEQEQVRILLSPQAAGTPPVVTPLPVVTDPAQPTASSSFSMRESTAAPRSDDGGKRPLYKNPWLWTGVGVAVAAVAVGLAVGLSRGDDGAPARAISGEPGAVINLN